MDNFLMNDDEKPFETISKDLQMTAPIEAQIQANNSSV